VREGIETVLFLTALFFVDPSGTAIGMMIGLGLVVSLVLTILRKTRHINVRSFFKYSSILLVVLAAGLAGFGVHEILEASESYGIEIGILGQAAFNINPADAANIFHENGAVGSFLKAMVGYDGNPEWLRVIVYLGYWLVIGAFVAKTYGSRTRGQTVIPTTTATA
jgi:high-affinity iron transporter